MTPWDVWEWSFFPTLSTESSWGWGGCWDASCGVVSCMGIVLSSGRDFSTLPGPCRVGRTICRIGKNPPPRDQRARYWAISGHSIGSE
ncbi:hypothetical protein GCM10020260_01050 [Nesterenkonia halobia]|uniref:Secreted protein n=1 Tax=Nesterenkonia halobia TaxID=37922 RepID=A0ABP6RDE1_9MICC